jgi:hypothetical protein
MQEERTQRFEDFVNWFDNHITGYEKGEGQIFFNKLVQSFGNDGVLEIGASCEERVKKRKGTTGFVDFIWSPRVVIELKERGTRLDKHFSQIFEYWWSLRPRQPEYMVLCNFDEFWIYQLNKQDEPVHILKTKDLANQWAALAFLFPKAERPVFNNDNEEVTIKAASTIGSMFMSMTKRKVNPTVAQKFVLQIVVSLFAEDVKLIPKNTIYKILEDAVQKDIKTQKELTDLFIAMANKDTSKKPKKYKEIPYFNGGIFEDVETVELNYKELDLLFDAAKKDWSKVRPSIFGSIFESSMDQDKRHNLGAHFTSEGDIQKIVYPTIVMPIRKKIEVAKTKPALTKVLEEIRKFKVLDPACGSGNFLYVAFKELRRLEVEVMELLAEKTGSQQISFSMISPKNFYGIDVNGFGVELAKVALCIGRKLSADEFKVQDTVLPFENLDDHFFKTDALFSKWPDVDAIIGNPPFLGSRKMRDSGFADEYMEKLWSLYPDNEFPGNADFCCYWFRKAHDQKAKYVGLVGSNSITQNESRKASLGYITNHNGIIHYAVSSQVWSGDAKVHVSIVNWVKENWSEKYILDGLEVSQINSSLKSESDVSGACPLQVNKNICFQGVVPMPLERYLLTEQQARDFIKKDKKNELVIKRLLAADDVTDKYDLKPDRFIIDFNDWSIEASSKFKLPFEFIEHKKSEEKKKKDIHKKWWQLWRPRMEMKNSINGLDKYITIPGVSKWTIPVVVSSDWRAYVNSTFVIASKDYFLLGVLSSKLHRDWVLAQSSTLKGDTRYTNTTCFETFPFLWSIDEKQKNKIRHIMKQLDDYRLKIMSQNEYGITKLYNQFFHEPSSQLHKLHEELNKACCELYGWKYDPTKNYNDQLFKLNQQMYKKEAGAQGDFLEVSAKENIAKKKAKKTKKSAK